jgi:hypothetical protein
MFRRLFVAVVATLFVLAWAAPALATQAASSQKPASQAQPPAKKAKKVWTNEDLEALRPDGFIPSAAASAASEDASAGESAKKADADNKGKEEDPVEKILKRLTPLRTELASVEGQLRSLRQGRASGNTTSGAMNMNKAPGGLNTDDQINLLEKRRADLLRQIAGLEDEARRAGVSPGAIR